MITCTDKAANYFQMPESMLNIFYKHHLFTHFCGYHDKDFSGGLSYDEFRYSFGLFAAKTRLGLGAFDYNRNGLFDEDEAEAWDNLYATLMVGELSWIISNEQRACLESAKYSSKDQQL